MSARSGSIEALGWERLEYSNPGLGIPSIGLVVSGATMILIAYLGPYLETNLGTNAGAELAVTIFLGASASFAASMAVLLYYRSVTYKLKKITLIYTHDRIGEVPMKMSYTNQRNKNRTDLRVKVIEPRPGVPLLRPSGKYEFAVRETDSSLRIRFQGGLMVELGFPDERSMIDAFSQISSS